MLSYRHVSHAGNFADLHKHLVLTHLLAALRAGEGPFFCVDTHGGRGLYDLDSFPARKTGEAAEGIGRLRISAGFPEAFAPCLEAVRAVNPASGHRFYPGSPLIIRHFMRPGDRLVVTELQRSEASALKQLFACDPQVLVLRQDGYRALQAHLPPKEQRGMVLIDPPYERHDEFDRAAATLAGGWRRWPAGMFVLWYPIESRAAADRLHRSVEAAGVRKVIVSEFLRCAVDRDDRLNGSGVLVVNPPPTLQAALDRVLPWLLARLATGSGGGARTEWLLRE